MQVNGSGSASKSFKETLPVTLFLYCRLLQAEELAAAHDALTELLDRLQSDSPCRDILDALPARPARPGLSQRLKNFGRSLMYGSEKEDDAPTSGCLLNEPTLQVSPEPRTPRSGRFSP